MADNTQKEASALDAMLSDGHEMISNVFRITSRTDATRKSVVDAYSKRISLFGSCAPKIVERTSGDNPEDVMDILNNSDYAKGAPTNYTQNAEKWKATARGLAESLKANGFTKAQSDALVKALENGTMIVCVLQPTIGTVPEKDKAPVLALGSVEKVSLDF